MKLLNPFSINENKVDKEPGKPKLHKFEYLGQKIVYDANSMLAYALKDSENVEIEGCEEHKTISYYPEQKFKHIVFQATYACNLNCRYCFVKQHYCDQENSIQADEVKKYLQKFQGAGPYQFGFFGGEPIMMWEMIFEVNEWAKKQHEKIGKPQAAIHITTNATLITEEIAEYCAENNFTWIVSVDGDEKTHNNNRPYEDGTGTWEDTIRGLRFLAGAYRKAGKQAAITLRGTFDNESSALLSSTQVLNSLMYKGLAEHVSVEPASLGEGCATSDSSRFEKNTAKEIRAKFKPQYEATAKWYLAEIQAGRNPSLHHFDMNLQRIIDREFSFTECGAGKGYISIGAGGNIAACHRENKTHIGENGRINRIKQAKWMDNRLCSRDYCQNCWKKYLCGGGCRANSMLVHNNTHKPSEMECLFHTFAIEASLWIASQLTPAQLKRFSKTSRKPRIQYNLAPTIVAEKKLVKQLPADAAKSCSYECQTTCMYPVEVESRNDCSCSIEKKKDSCSCDLEKCSEKK